jgi:hypothetical protein
MNKNHFKASYIADSIRSISMAIESFEEKQQTPEMRKHLVTLHNERARLCREYREATGTPYQETRHKVFKVT